MRTFTTTHTVYNFDELSDEAKEKALNYFRENNWYDFLGDDLQYKLEELLKDNNIHFDELPKVYYSLGYSQGDGVMFEGTVKWKYYTVEIRQSGHYYHYNSKQFWNFENSRTGREVSDKVYKQFDELYVRICKELEKYGYDIIEYEQSEEYLKEMIEGNEYEFTEDGKLI